LLAEGKLPEASGKPAVIEISLTALVAGTKYRAEFVERMEAVGPRGVDGTEAAALHR
jgi:ATP-dependent Clp protease ATP-binding subunit ClpA